MKKIKNNKNNNNNNKLLFYNKNKIYKQKKIMNKKILEKIVV